MVYMIDRLMTITRKKAVPTYIIAPLLEFGQFLSPLKMRVRGSSSTKKCWTELELVDCTILTNEGYWCSHHCSIWIGLTSLKSENCMSTRRTCLAACY